VKEILAVLFNIKSSHVLYDERVRNGRRELILIFCLKYESCDLESCVDVLSDVRGRVLLEGMKSVQGACLMFDSEGSQVVFIDK